jgi:hypothetical protein
VIRLLVGATLLKLALAALPGGTADIAQQRQQAEIYLAGQDVLDPRHSNPARFPLGHYALTVGALASARATGTPFHFWIRVPAVLADLGIALLLLAAAQPGRRAALLYMLSPITVLLSAYHGQVHTVATALALGALWLGLRDRAVLGGLVLGLAVAVRQHFAVLLLPLARRLGTGATLPVLAFAAIVLAINAPLLASPHVHTTLAPTWSYGTWGYSIVLRQGPRVLAVLGVPGADTALAPLNTALAAAGSAVYVAWAALFAWWVWWRPAVDPWRAALLFLAGFYAVSPGFGVQWLVWALPFWILVSFRGALVYAALTSVFAASLYWVWRFNARYGVDSVTANLGVLGGGDLALYMLTGLLGLVTWMYCVAAAWRLWRA